MAWDFTVALDPASPSPLFAQLADAIAAAIADGRLPPGYRLPGTRRLASSIGVHRNTVVAAYDELASQGWVDAQRARGTFVRSSLPTPLLTPLVSDARSELSYCIPPASERTWRPRDATPDGLLHMRGGMPDPRLLPSELVGRAYRRVVSRRGRTLFDYGDPRGLLELRTAIAEMLGLLRGIACTPDHILVTRGSQMAIYLTAQRLLQPGDGVAVEGLGYQPAWEALATSGAELFPIEVDAEGLVVEQLGEMASRHGRLRAVYLTPHHQYPTTVVLSAARRLELMTLAREQQLLIIEDDYDNEFHYEGTPVLPLAAQVGSLAHVVYVGTWSKVLAPGLRIGYVCAHPTTIANLAALRKVVDRQGDQATEATVAALTAEGETLRHVRRVRRIYKSRRDVLVACLRRELGEAFDFRTPRGGMALWLRARELANTEQLVEMSAARGVLVGGEAMYRFDGRPGRHLRLGFASLSEDEIQRGVSLVAEAHHTLVGS